MPVRISDTFREILRKDFYAFVHRAFRELHPSTPFLPNSHIEEIISALMDVVHGKCKRLIINVPPRSLKSHIVSVCFPAWLQGLRPELKFLCLSYGQELADDLARQSRDLMDRPFYKATFETRISPDKDSVNMFKTMAGGYRISTSLAGGITGRGADYIIVDDSQKADEALSDAKRRGVHVAFDNTVRSRLNSQDGGIIIIVQQRLHADDLVAHVQRNENWRVLALPMIAEEAYEAVITTPYGLLSIRRNVGDLLHPAQTSAASVEVLKNTIQPYNWFAQYQQNPQPVSGVILQRRWLKYYPERPDKFDQIIASLDTANKESELANYSCCTIWGRKGSHMYLLHVYREKVDFPKLKRAVMDLQRQFKVDVFLIEDKASGTALIQELRNQGYLWVRESPPADANKVTRLHGQTSKFAEGLVLLPSAAPWIDTYVDELLAFPNARYDDQVDSTVHALAWITTNPVEPFGVTWAKIEAAKATGGAVNTSQTPLLKTRMRPWQPTSTLHLLDPETCQTTLVMNEGDGTFWIPDNLVSLARSIGFTEA